MKRPDTSHFRKRKKKKSKHPGEASADTCWTPSALQRTVSISHTLTSHRNVLDYLDWEIYQNSEVHGANGCFLQEVEKRHSETTRSHVIAAACSFTSGKPRPPELTFLRFRGYCFKIGSLSSHFQKEVAFEVGSASCHVPVLVPVMGST